MKRIFLAVAAALALSACGGGEAAEVAEADAPQEANTAAEEPELVKVASPELVANTRTLNATGTLRARRETQLSFSAPGRVAALNVNEGDYVKNGALLARLDPAQVGSANVAAKAELDRAQAEYERQKYLFDRGWVTAPRIEAAEAALKSARAQVRSTEFDTRLARISAPVGGIVLTRHVEPNQIVAAGQPVVTLAETARGFVLRVPVTDRDLVSLTVGAPAMVTIDALGGKPIKGQISEIGALSNAQTGTFEVEVSVPNMRGLRSGLVGKVEIVLADGGASDRLIGIPAMAIFDARAGEGFVYLARERDGKLTAALQLVTIERIDGESALLSGGIAEGDRIIVSGIDRIKPNSAIRLARP